MFFFIESVKLVATFRSMQIISHAADAAFVRISLICRKSSEFCLCFPGCHAHQTRHGAVFQQPILPHVPVWQQRLCCAGKSLREWAVFICRVNDVTVVCNLKLISQDYWHNDGWTWLVNYHRLFQLTRSVNQVISLTLGVTESKDKTEIITDYRWVMVYSSHLHLFKWISIPN